MFYAVVFLSFFGGTFGSVVFVGVGPATLYTADEVLKNTNFDVFLVDKRSIAERTRQQVVQLKSLHPDIGGLWARLPVPLREVLWPNDPWKLWNPSEPTHIGCIELSNFERKYLEYLQETYGHRVKLFRKHVVVSYPVSQKDNVGNDAEICLLKELPAKLGICGRLELLILGTGSSQLGRDLRDKFESKIVQKQLLSSHGFYATFKVDKTILALSKTEQCLDGNGVYYYVPSLDEQGSTQIYLFPDADDPNLANNIQALSIKAPEGLSLTRGGAVARLTRRAKELISQSVKNTNILISQDELGVPRKEMYVPEKLTWNYAERKEYYYKNVHFQLTDNVSTEIPAENVVFIGDEASVIAYLQGASFDKFMSNAVYAIQKFLAKPTHRVQDLAISYEEAWNEYLVKYLNYRA